MTKVINWVATPVTGKSCKSLKYVPKAKRAPPNPVSKALVLLTGAIVSMSSKVLEKVSSLLLVGQATRSAHKCNYPNGKRSFKNRRKKSSRNFRLRSRTPKQARIGFILLKIRKSSQDISTKHISNQTTQANHQAPSILQQYHRMVATINKVIKWCHSTTGSNHRAFVTSYDDRINKVAIFDTDSFPIVVDSGCSRTLSSYEEDFDPSTLKYTTGKAGSVQGFAGSSSTIAATGTIRWKIIDDTGEMREINIPNSLLVPSTKARLLSPQHLAQESTSIVMYVVKAREAVLSWETTTTTSSNNKILATKTMGIDRESANVATMWAAHGFKKFKAFEARIPRPSESPIMHLNKGSLMELADKLRDEAFKLDIGTDFWKQSLNTPITDPLEETYLNIKKPQDAKLLWHQRLGHVSMDRIDRLSNLGYLPSFLAKCPHPVCQACIYGKMTRRPWRTKPALDDEKSATATAVGATISVDQLESPILGFCGQLKGMLTKRRYRVATVFVDHHSDYSFVFLQQSTTSDETVLAKHAFEQHAQSFGVRVLHYHADNGRFADNAWRDDVAKQGQKLTFSGVGAHHQNGRAEKRIRDIQDLARTSLIQANRMWPDAISSHLWPYALRHANDSINNTHFKGHDLTPVEIFSNSGVTPNVSQSHPFGCPAYALDGVIQGGQKGPKWNSRARMAIYLGASPQHASTVGLLLSLTTGLVSPQFHVRYDDTFQTLRKPSYVVPSMWQRMAGFKKEKQTATSINDQPDDPVAIPNVENRTQDASQPTGNVMDYQTQQLDIADAFRELTDEEEASIDVAAVPEMPPLIQQPQHQPRPQSRQQFQHVQHQPRTTRAGRTTARPGGLDDFVVYSVDSTESEGGIDILESAFAASSDPDVLYLHQALQAPDRDEFIKAMDKEVQAHEDGRNWMVVDRADIPEGKTVVPSVWAMRRKRDIATQTVYKWKARLNFHGGKQHKGIDFWETYAPVASWAAIRLIMLIAVFGCWYTKQLDFVLAFPQAPVETDLYMEIPQGYTIEGDPKSKALKLINNLYGQRQAGRVWNKFLTKGLISIGFTQSKHDECIFWRNNVIIVIYTDDTIVTSRVEAEVDAAIRDIGALFEITHKPKVEDFLGVKIDRDMNTGIVTFTQPHLIDSIIIDVGLKDDSTTRAIPALVSQVLHKHPDSLPHSADWSYRSVIGKLNYLAKSTRPDIEYAVHQCARFSSEPKEEHTKAVKLIVRYLLSTKDKGMICKPDGQSMTCYADANFAGDWLPEIAEDDASTARSRSGYILLYSGCPVIWASKLQTEIAMSSTESEYISLSQSLREVIPLMRLIKEMKQCGFDLPINTPEVHCKAFEDNNGALEMAQTPKMRPRTKHLNIKYHHFREAVAEKLITIHRVCTEEQMADIFTKPLGVLLFERFRKMIMGW